MRLHKATLNRSHRPRIRRVVSAPDTPCHGTTAPPNPAVPTQKAAVNQLKNTQGKQFKHRANRLILLD
ncbi:hypothetical protein E2C01_006195 [Portunus trituberculatus]|uniref:Uncharacterized protein n=1 Tax=Portunus trituberculatus TaxID=210409 RepID=A0A5B7CVP4_PORTR|nr:hypothetical protein [Portunus trituberculatus]